MKLSIFISSLGLVTLSAAWHTPVSTLELSRMMGIYQLSRRQVDFTTSLQSMFKEYMINKPVKTVQLESSGRRPGAKRVKLFFGPYNLPKKGEKSPMASIQFDANSKTWAGLVDFPADITILFSNHYLEYEDGRRANASNGVYSHHTLYFDVSKPWKTAWGCPGPLGSYYPQIRMPNPLNNQVEDNTITTFTSPDGKLDSGYYIGKNDIIMNIGEVINYNDEAKNIYVVADLEYLPGKQQGFLDSSIQALFVTGCDWSNVGGAMNLKLPAGTTKHTFKSQEMMIMEDGYIVNLMGHLHDGGTKINLVLNNKTICESKAVYGKADSHSHGMMGTGSNEGNIKGQAANATNADRGDAYEGIIAMTRCEQPIKVSKGELFTVEAAFDFDMHPPRSQTRGGTGDIMGMFAAIFAKAV